MRADCAMFLLAKSVRSCEKYQVHCGSYPLVMRIGSYGSATEAFPQCCCGFIVLPLDMQS